MKRLFKYFNLFAIFAVLFITAVSTAYCQQGIGTNAPDPNAVLHLKSANQDQGLIIPQVTTANRPAASTSIAGMLIYNITTNTFQTCNGTSWSNVPNSNGDNLGNHTATTDLNMGNNSIDFGTFQGHRLNLYSNTAHAIGVQTNTNYYRTPSAHAWFRNGVHTNTQFNAGTGGTTQMVLTNTDRLGLGTTNPLSKLHVQGSFSPTSSTNTSILSSGIFGGGLGLRNVNNKVSGFWTTDLSGVETLNLRVGSVTNFGSTNGDFFFNESGKFGVGCVQPVAHLEVSAGSNPEIRISENQSTAHYINILDVQNNLAQINKTGSNSSTLDISAAPLDGAGDASIRLFRNTNTTGNAELEILKGDGTSTQNSVLRGNGNSFLNNNVGSVGIGTTVPDAKLHIDAGAVSNTAGTNVHVARMSSGSGLHNNRLEVFNRRFATGSSWEKTNMRIRRKVDSSPMAFIDFGINGATNNQGYRGLGLGTETGTHMAITLDGNIGMGTTTPLSSAKVQIAGANSSVGGLVVTNANNQAATWFPWIDGSNYITGDAQIGTGNTIIRKYDGSYQNLMTIEAATGNVGIGNDNTPAEDLTIIRGNNPTLALHATSIHGSIPGGKIRYNTPTATDWESSGIEFITKNTDGGNFEDIVMKITGGNATRKGKVGIGTTSPINTLEIKDEASGAYQFGVASAARALDIQVGGTNCNIDFSNEGGLRFNSKPYSERGTTGTRVQLMNLTGAGFLGIGTSAPENKLEVESNGSIANIGVERTGGKWAEFLAGTNGTGVTFDNSAFFSIFTSSTRSNSSPNELVRVTNAGNMGIGTTAPTHKLHVNGVARSTQSTWATSSDRRVKKNIEPIQAALATINQFKPVEFEWKKAYLKNHNMPEKQYGFIAQEVKEVLPRMVTKIEEKVGNDVITDFNLLNTAELTPLLVKAVQELSAKVERLEQENQQLKAITAEVEQIKTLLKTQTFNAE